MLTCRILRKAYLLLVLAAAALTCVVAATPATAVSAGAFTYRGTVTHIVDGDTLDVRLTSGKTERIRLIGIDTPERGDCYFSQATVRARQLAMSMTKMSVAPTSTSWSMISDTSFFSTMAEIA